MEEMSLVLPFTFSFTAAHFHLALCKERFPMKAVYKSGTGTRGRGHRDACVGTSDFGTRDKGLEDIKYGTRGRQIQGRRGSGM